MLQWKETKHEKPKLPDAALSASEDVILFDGIATCAIGYTHSRYKDEWMVYVHNGVTVSESLGNFPFWAYINLPEET